MRTFLIIPILLLSIKSLCQELSYRQYTVKDGLPGAVVYHALQDKNGFMWFATNQGVSCFDGRRFINYFREDGLPDNEIIKLYLDRHNNVWFISLMGIPAVFRNGKISRFDGCKGVIGICEDILSDSIVLIAQQRLKAPGIKGYYSSANTPGRWQFTPHFRTYSKDYLTGWPVIRASSPGGVNFYFSTVNEQYNAVWLKNAAFTRHYLFRKNILHEAAFDQHAFFSLTASQNGMILCSADSIYYCDLNRMRPAVSLKKLGLMPEESDDLNSLFCEDDSTLWVCTRNQGLLRLKDFLTPHFSVRSFFSNSFCTSIIKDQENGYWITTHGDGVFYVPNFSFYSVSTPAAIAAKNALCIRATDSTSIVVGFADGNIIEIDHPGLQRPHLLQQWTQTANNRILDIWRLSRDTMLIGADKTFHLLSPRESKSLIPLAIKAIYVQPDHTVFIATAVGIAQMNLATGRSRWLFQDRTTSLTGFNGHLYWGTQNGAYAFTNDTVRYLGAKYPALAGTINHLDIAPDTALWVSTQQGLAILKDSGITLIGKEQGLLSNTCKHVSFDKHTAWVATDKGIARIDHQWRNGKLYYLLSGITEEDGLTANDVNQTIPLGNYIWAATARGVSFFSKDYVSHSVVRPLININRIMVGDMELPIGDTVTLNHKKIKLQIGLSGISYRSGKQIRYEYRLKGLDSTWNSITGSTIEFPALPFGRFIFEVHAVDKWGERSVWPKSIVIVNDPPIWKTTWFQVSAYLVSIALLSLGFYGVYRREQKKKDNEYQLKRKMHELEMMALRAQMNPHFIFNCLTSIQYHIIRADVKSANAYLHKLSVLIRKILQHSTSSIISLREEVRILELYLELEKLRLGDRMEYQVNVSGDISQDDIFIPAMIIQPYVENAVKHGVAALEDKKGRLLIGISRRSDYIECVIEDNGPGVYSSLQGNAAASNDYIPMGAGITASRINTINLAQKNKIILQVTDKQQSGGTTSGTIIHLSFPIKNN